VDVTFQAWNQNIGRSELTLKKGVRLAAQRPVLLQSSARTLQASNSIEPARTL
jgi:hypothetical protein